MKTKGVIYTAGGDISFVKEAIFSAKTLKKHNPKLSTTLFTTFQGIKSKYFDQIIYHPPTMHPMKYKIVDMLSSPYDYTLYLDTDTMITDKIYEIFDFLLIYDIGFTHRVKAKWSSHPEFIDYIDFDTIQTGFVLFRKKPNVINFLKAWNDEMQKNPDDKIKSGLPTGDQATLNRLVKEKDIFNLYRINYFFLPNKVYNARPWLWEQAKKDGEWQQIKIFHAHNLNKNLYQKLQTLAIKAKHKLNKLHKQ